MSTVSNKIKVTYWLTTLLIGISSLFAVFQANSPEAIEIFNQLGVGAAWFRWEVEIGKTIGGMILLIPMIRGRIKEWIYAAFGIDFISAFIALWAINGFEQAWFVLIFIVILWLSYWSYHRMYEEKMPLV
jgi:hypothetical protein